MIKYRIFHELQLEENFEFRDGDVASYGGMIGRVEISNKNAILRVNECNLFSFSIKGLYSSAHSEPTLILIERPKKMVEKTIEVYVSDGAIGLFQNDENIYSSVYIATQTRPSQMNKIKITYEVVENE